ncbi:MAG: cysteine desulfurase [Hyphomicrobiaceae bacterium]|nr:cysteine desulfurase [Hyphomicrobiaceae bacterium]
MTAQARAYLDTNASAPVLPSVIAAMTQALLMFGNASSVHAEGRAARRAIESAREDVAVLVGARAKAVVFTSGATEANGTALCPDWRVAGRPARFERLLVGATEHASILAGGRFANGQVTIVPVDADGLIRRDAMAALLAEGGPALVAVQLANNETGVIQPIAEIATLVHQAGGLLHCDAVQAPGRLRVSIGLIGADSLALSAHKLGGPQGIGALVLADLDTGPAPLLTGGGQEHHRRAGSENLAAIVGFAQAARETFAGNDEIVRLTVLRDWLEAELRSISPSIRVFGYGAERIGNTSLFAAPGVSAETALIRLDLEGVSVSSGSACSSGKVGLSHVLTAMGVEAELARGGLRVSLGHHNTEADVRRFRDVFAGIVERAGAKRSGIAA